MVCLKCALREQPRWLRFRVLERATNGAAFCLTEMQCRATLADVAVVVWYSRNVFTLQGDDQLVHDGDPLKQ